MKNIERTAKIQAKTTAEKLSAEEQPIHFLCMSLFRAFVYFSVLPARSPLQAHHLWIERRVAHLNTRKKKQAYIPSDYLPELDETPKALLKRRNIFCSTSSIREFYLHNFIASANQEQSGLFSVLLCAEGGIYSTQFIANSLQQAFDLLQSEQKHIFNEHISNLEKYQQFVTELDFEKHRIIEEELPCCWLSSAIIDRDSLQLARGSKIGQEWCFSQEAYTLCIIPTLEAF